LRLSAWLHWVLAAYLWLISCVSLGNWNAQAGPHLIASLLAGNAGLRQMRRGDRTL
jgi:hypothetical protein